MTAKEYLGEIRRLTYVIEDYEKSLEMLRNDIASIQGISYDRDRVQVPASSDTTINKIIRLDQLAKEVEDITIEKARLRARIVTQITMMKDWNYNQLLFKRYVEFKKFELIAVEMNYAYQSVVNMHGEALKKFEELYKDSIQ